MSAENRKYPRLELGRSVTILLPARCTMSDISRRGARLTVDDVDSVPDRFVVEIRNDLRQWCEVVWRRGTQVGVKYIAVPEAFRGENEQAETVLAEYERLEAARDALARDRMAADGQQELLSVAKDMSACRLPAIQAVAESLCKLIEHGLQIGHIPDEFIDHHVDAVGAIIREYTRADHVEMARELIAELHRLTDKFTQPAAA